MKATLYGRNSSGVLSAYRGNLDYEEAVRMGQTLFGKGNFLCDTGENVPSADTQLLRNKKKAKKFKAKIDKLREAL